MEREAFSAQWRRLCPPSELVAYWAPGNIIHDGMRIHLHPASLGWSASASTKPLPYPKTFLALADEFFTHAFLTAEEPLRVWVPPDVGGDLLPSLCQGYGPHVFIVVPFGSRIPDEDRSTTFFVSLWASACIVFATVETHVDWVSVAIANASISSRGAIRQAHDVIIWAGWRPEA